jgi:MFS family permease
MATKDVLETLKVRRMSASQYVTVAVGLLLVVLDGYDIALTSFSSPYIAKGFGIAPTELGMVGSGALVGLFIGATVVAPLGDKIGRRTTAILGSVLATLGMFLSAAADTLSVLIAGRIVAGIGIGTLIAAIAIIFSELVSRKAYPLVMALYAAGIPLGTFIGAELVGPIVADHGWRIGFEIGAIVTALSIPLTLIFMPESLAYLAGSRRADALARFNKTLRKLGIAPVSELPAAENLTKVKHPIGEVLKGRLLARTALAALAYFLFMLSFYFATNWAPKYLADVTGDPTSAPSLMSAFSVGGLVGVAVFAIVTARSNPKALYLMTGAVTLLSSVGLIWYGHAATVQSHPHLIFGMASFFLAATTAGFYAITPRLYPEKVRSTGYGVVIGVGRIGGIIAPTLGGWFFDAGTDPQTIFWVFGIPLVASTVITLVLMGFRHDRPEVTVPAAREAVAA